MVFCGDRNGALTGVTPQCKNQAAFVQATGTLGGRTYNVEISDPTTTPNNGLNDFATVFEYATDPSGSASAWQLMSPAGISNWNYSAGADFDLQLVPAPVYGSEATGPLHVVGQIRC